MRRRAGFHSLPKRVSYVSNRVGANNGTYASETEIAEDAYACSWVEEEVGWLDVTVYYTAHVYIAEGTEHAAKVFFYCRKWERTVIMLPGKKLSINTLNTSQGYKSEGEAQVDAPESLRFDSRA